MIDGIKATALGINPDVLRSRLEFFTPINDSTGEAAPYSYARLGNLRLTLTRYQTCIIRGSIHKYAHNGLNSTDFGFSDLIRCIGNLADYFEVEPGNFALHNVEFGVNLDYPPSKILENVLLYGSIPFVPNSNNARKSTGVKCDLSQYSFKLYGKNQTRLRLETQVKRMQYVRKAGGQLLTLESLTDKIKLEAFGNILLDTWGKVLILEETSTEGLKPLEQEVLNWGSNPRNWVHLQNTNPENYRKKRKRFSSLQDTHGLTTRKADIERLAGEKWAELLGA